MRPSVTSLSAFALTAEPRRAVARLGRRCGLLILLQEVRDALGRLRALLDPVIDSRNVEAQSLLAAGRDGIEEPNPLEITPVAATPTIRDYDVEERALQCAA